MECDRADADQAKQAVRERVWDLLEHAGAAPPHVHGRIPAFDGSAAAADLLAALPVWRAARVIKAVPDKAQMPVRARALADGKFLYMAVPMLADALPFYELDPEVLPVTPAEAADRELAAQVGRKVAVAEMRPVDLVVCGSVAVSPRGTRLGKGAGYSDIEVALLAEAGLIGKQTTIVTTVHELQVIDEDLPEQDHDFRVDLIITPQRVIHCDSPKRPAGLDWSRLTPEKIAGIPALAARANRSC
jgi:5-formyltetrahydrofolate cyclo-ligase